ncbi:MAG: carboxylesterase family protein [Oscillospiraceae bacterium]|nr:carboxylesterase family protein [Oscillospiraceae bacterium]
MSRATIQTKYGTVCGVVDQKGDIVSYKGVPFAAPPVGERRFAPPQPPEPWEGELVCDGFRPACVQPFRSSFGHPPRRCFTAEDCLYLNIWTPAERGDAPLPVMLWIYGGGFTSGRAAAPELDGAALARKGVILVTCTYRCGPLGFFALPELAARAGTDTPRNLGLLDQIAALEWIRDNIAAFGGDSGNVTIFGQSAGGMSVRMLLCAPPAAGLFRRAIVHSGGGLNEGDPIRPLAEMEALCARALAHLGWTVDDLLRRDAQEVTEKLIDAGNAVTERELYVFQPFIDGYSIVDVPGKLICAGAFPENVSLMCGTVSGDSWMFSRKVRPLLENNQAALRAFSYSPTISWGRTQVKNGRAPLYGYYYEHLRPGEQPLRTPDGTVQTIAVHGSEIPFVFGNLNGGDSGTDYPWTPYDYALSGAMGDYWVNFAETGDPNGGGLPHWEPFTASAPEVMHFRDDGWGMANIVDHPEAERVIQYTMEHPGMLEDLQGF